MSQATLPAHTPVVVIGGGIMGGSTQSHLAGEGIGDAILLERKQFTSGTPGLRRRRCVRAPVAVSPT